MATVKLLMSKDLFGLTAACPSVLGVSVSSLGTVGGTAVAKPSGSGYRPALKPIGGDMTESSAATPDSMTNSIRTAYANGEGKGASANVVRDNATFLGHQPLVDEARGIPPRGRPV